jgi:hypothetical protein
MNLGTSWEMLQPLHLWYPLEWSVSELQRKSRQFTKEKNLLPQPVIRTQFFGYPASSSVNKMTNVYILLQSTLAYTMLHSLLALRKNYHHRTKNYAQQNKCCMYTYSQ